MLPSYELAVNTWFHGLTLGSIYLGRKKQSLIINFLLLSVFLQFQLRDILYKLGVNLNVIFGIDSTSELYLQSLITISTFHTVLIASISAIWKSQESSELNRENQKQWPIWLLVIVIWIGFVYFGGLTFDGEQTRAEGSSALVLIGLIIVARATIERKRWLASLFHAMSAIFVTTQKLLALIFLSRFLRKLTILKLVLISLAAMMLIVVTSILRGEIIADQTIAGRLAASLFGHYESILPLYKYLENKTGFVSPWQFAVAYLDVFGVYVRREDTIYIRFNEQYFTNLGVIIVPTILCIYLEIFGRLGIVLCAIVIPIQLKMIRAAFSWVSTDSLSIPLTIGYALLIVEASPDALTTFHRLILILALLKLLTLQTKRLKNVRTI